MTGPVILSEAYRTWEGAEEGAAAGMESVQGVGVGVKGKGQCQ